MSTEQYEMTTWFTDLRDGSEDYADGFTEPTAVECAVHFDSELVPFTAEEGRYEYTRAEIRTFTGRVVGRWAPNGGWTFSP